MKRALSYARFSKRSAASLTFRFKCSWFGFLVAVVLLLPDSQIQAASSKTPNIRLQGDSGAFVQKSNTIGGTDFGTMNHGRLEIRGGSNQNISLEIDWDQMSTSFTQLDGKMSSSWTDVSVGYQIKWFKPSLSFGTCHFIAETADQSDSQLMDTLCTTVGGGFDVDYSVTKVIQVFLDTQAMKPDLARDLEGRDVSIGLRSDLEAGVIFKLPVPGVEITTGFRLRKFSITTEAYGTTSEMQTGPVLGLSYGLAL